MTFRPYSVKLLQKLADFTAAIITRDKLGVLHDTQIFFVFLCVSSLTFKLFDIFPTQRTFSMEARLLRIPRRCPSPDVTCKNTSHSKSVYTWLWCLMCAGMCMVEKDGWSQKEKAVEKDHPQDENECLYVNAHWCVWCRLPNENVASPQRCGFSEADSQLAVRLHL